MSSAAAWTYAGGLLREARLARLHVPHGFTHRGLGDMKSGAFRAAACRIAGLGEPRVFARQEHGAEVREAGAESPGTVAETGDGWIVREPGRAVGVYAADCLPLLMWDDRLRTAGAFHAGWRGVAKGMAEAAVRAFKKLGVGPESLNAAIGPHIEEGCYEVGAEFEDLFPPASLSRKDSKLYLDLGREAARRLTAAGLRPDAVSVSPDCTLCRGGDFFSYRRDGKCPSHLAFIAVPK